MERRKKGIVLILIAILIFGVFAGVEFFGKKEKKEPAQTSATAAIPSATPIPTSGNNYSETTGRCRNRRR